MPDQISVLFVCLGNICRSTMSEGVFQAMAKKEPYRDLISRIDSCGTAGYHVGEEPDHRTMATLRSKGIRDYVHLGRKLRPSDFDTFDYVFVMDRSNLADVQRELQRKKTPSKAKVMLFGEYSGQPGGRAEIVEDPYYGGSEGFEMAYEQATRFSRNFLREVFPNVKAEL